MLRINRFRQGNLCKLTLVLSNRTSPSTFQSLRFNQSHTNKPSTLGFSTKNVTFSTSENTPTVNDSSNEPHPDLNLNNHTAETIYSNYLELTQANPTLEAELSIEWYISYVKKLCDTIKAIISSPDFNRSSYQYHLKILGLIIQDKILISDQLKKFDLKLLNHFILEISKLRELNIVPKIWSIIAEKADYEDGYDETTLKYLLILSINEKNVAFTIKFLDLIQSKHLPLSRSTVSILVKFLAKNDRLQAVDQLVEYISHHCDHHCSHHCDHLLNLKLFTELIQVYCKHGKIESAEKLLAQMKQLKIEPDDHIFSILIDGYVRSGQTDNINEIYTKRFNQVSDPSTTLVVENIMMKSRLNDLDYALKIFKELKKKGIQPNLYFYHTLMMGYIKLGDIQSAEKVHLELEWNGIQSTWMTYSILLSHYYKRRDLQGALKVFDQFCLSAIPQHIQIYNTIIDLSYKLSQPAVGSKLLSQALSQGLKPNRDSYNNLMNFYLTTKNYSNGIDVYNLMKRHRIPIDSIALDLYLRILLRNQNFDLAKKEYYLMVNTQKLQPDQRLVSTMLYGMINNSNLSEMITFFNHALHTYKIEPSIQMYNHIITAYSRRDMLDSAERILDQALSASERYPACQLSENTWSIFLVGAIHKGQVDQMEYEFQRFQNPPYNLKPTLYILNTLMFGYYKVGKFEKAIQIYEQIKSSETFQADEHTLRTYLFCCVNMLTPSKFIEEFNSLIDTYPKEVTNKKEVYAAYSICLFKLKEYQTILDLVINRMDKEEIPFHYDLINPIYGRLKALNGEEFELLKLFIQKKHPKIYGRLEKTYKIYREGDNNSVELVDELKHH